MSRAGRITGLFAAISVLIVVAAAMAAAVAFRHQQAPAAVPAKTPARVIQHMPVPYLGVVTTDLAEFDQAAGTRANLAVRYMAWGATSPVRSVTANAREGAITLLELLPRTVTLRQIASGSQDVYLRSLARTILHTGDQVMLSFAPEMNGGWYPWGYRHVTPALYVAAWRHVHEVIAGAGARNVIWLWQVSRHHPGTMSPRPLWPGRRYVTMAGIDGYYEAPSSTFRSTFVPTVREIRGFSNVPVLISETAVGRAAHPAVNIPGLFAGCRRLGLAGFVWFDLTQHDGPNHQNWRLEDTPAALAVFRREAAQYR